jgi:hypothetical protein
MLGAGGSANALPMITLAPEQPVLLYPGMQGLPQGYPAPGRGLYPDGGSDENVNMAGMKEASVGDTVSVRSTSIPKKPLYEYLGNIPLAFTPEENATFTSNRSNTGCITCRRSQKKCDEKKPGC